MAQHNDYSYNLPCAVRVARPLNAWLQGRCVHLWMPDLCCPDYSCCAPDLLVPLELRELYVQAHNDGDVQTLQRLDRMFLGRLLRHERLETL